ncbi:unnamed protein product [Acanthoscelides obtectus]|uniref:Uncharacterized protein n=1 Tax=Acanthoscelides obtectus TaxID=200917 RepID=A0A9P0KFB5_ACAOB|nr:unnamed protein product [Acanthoscelides obtectus]CAK1650990.1 hypothetical protein AOBTE_LOCUS17003 [Acanthoscelides obtectus]
MLSLNWRGITEVDNSYRITNYLL